MENLTQRGNQVGSRKFRIQEQILGAACCSQNLLRKITLLPAPKNYSAPCSEKLTIALKKYSVEAAYMNCY